MTTFAAACTALAGGAILLALSVILTVRDQERRETHLVNTTDHPGDTP